MDSGVPKFIDAIGSASGALTPVFWTITVAAVLAVVVPTAVFVAHNYGSAISRFAVRSAKYAFGWVKASAHTVAGSFHAPRFKLRTH